MRTLVALIRLTIFGLWNVIVVLVQGPAMFLLSKNGRLIYFIPNLWHKIACPLFGLRIQTIGTPRLDAQTLFVSNHLSYLDIPVLGYALPFASFVAKEDVANWPLFGLLAKFQQTAFISRKRQKAAAGKYALETMVKDGKSLILFPEGTSTPGKTVLPFKSSLFSIALDHDLTVQPVTIVLERVDDQSADDDAVRDLYAWYGDMTLPPHLWTITKARGAQITLIFHEPCAAAAFSTRKDMAAHCHQIVAGGLDSAPQTKAA